MAGSRIYSFLPLIGIAILVYLVIATGPGNIAGALAVRSPVFLALGIALITAYFVIENLRWKILLSSQGIKLGFFRLMKVFLIGTFYGSVTPGKVGTFIRAKYVKDMTGKDIGECSVSVVIEKALDVATLIILSLIGAFFISSLMPSGALFLILAMLLGFSLSLLLLLSKRTSRTMMKVVWRVAIPTSMKDSARKAFNSFFANMIGWRKIIVPFTLSVLGWLSVYFAAYMIALSIGIDVPFVAFMAVLPISTIIGMIPITVGGWGTREASWVVLFSFFGVAAGQTMALSILVAFLNSIIPSATGAVLSLRSSPGIPCERRKNRRL